MAHISEYEVENLFIDRLESIGYEFVELRDYHDVVANFRRQLAAFNAEKLTEAKGEASFSDAEFGRVMIHVDNHSVYESAKILRDKYVLQLDNGKSVYLDFFGSDVDRNIYQVTHQVTMDKAHKDDVVYKNRYDVTILINGLPIVQIELKRPGVEINEAINQINRYRKFSFKGLFRYLQLFVVSNSVQTKYFCNENEMDGGSYNPILKSLVFFWTDDKNTRINKLDEFTAEFLRRSTITEMLDKYMVIKTTEPVLMVMRPYQIYAVKAAKRRVLDSNQNGYVFACTGSGKTLTSFKLAQLLRDEPRVDKVIFLIDRKDLDDQTVDEYNSFEKDCVDGSDSTAVLVRQLKQDDRKLIVTTIQKMANAVKSKRYESLMDSYRDKKVVFIIDECHRSQFGKMHGDIERHFRNANYIGFTGTPIFEANRGKDGRTTADVFYAGTKLDACLHRYMIKDAIADGNVLRFSVEYQRTIFAKQVAAAGIDPEQMDDPDYCRRHNLDLESLYHDDERIRLVAADIFEHHEQHVHPQGKDVYTALFAVDTIKTLGKYYDAFKELNEARDADKRYRVAAIFTYQANEDMDEGGDEHSQELLERCMNDYNEMFGTAFGLDSFDAYRKDITRRMKQKDLPQVDILLVVNMMLTGFDAKPLNTLYLDKNLIWHTLVQAYSRTNRVDKVTKQFGQIVSYRNIKRAQDDALRLFSGDGDPNEYLLESYEYYLSRWMDQVPVLRKVTQTVDDAGQLQSEDDIRHFILALRHARDAEDVRQVRVGGSGRGARRGGVRGLQELVPLLPRRGGQARTEGPRARRRGFRRRAGPHRPHQRDVHPEPAEVGTRGQQGQGRGHGRPRARRRPRHARDRALGQRRAPREEGRHGGVHPHALLRPAGGRRRAAGLRAVRAREHAGRDRGVRPRERPRGEGCAGHPLGVHLRRERLRGGHPQEARGLPHGITEDHEDDESHQGVRHRHVQPL